MIKYTERLPYQLCFIGDEIGVFAVSAKELIERYRWRDCGGVKVMEVDDMVAYQLVMARIIELNFKVGQGQGERIS